MTSNEKSLMLKVTSDVHLGGGNSHPDLFRSMLVELLRDISEKKKDKIPKVLLILGDIFDILMDTFENITTEYLDVIRLLDKIHEYGVRVIITLGNHEISVTGDYDQKFTARKIEFLELFTYWLEKQNYISKVINKRNFCQYVIIKNNFNESDSQVDLQWEMFLYDSKYNISHELSNNIQPIKLDKCNLKKNANFLFCHGYQFFKRETLMAGELIWNPLFRSKPKTKEFINNFYNTSGTRDVLKKSTTFTEEFYVALWNTWRGELRKEIRDESKNFIDDHIKHAKKKSLMKKKEIEELDNEMKELMQSNEPETPEIKELKSIKLEMFLEKLKNLEKEYEMEKIKEETQEEEKSSFFSTLKTYPKKAYENLKEFGGYLKKYTTTTLETIKEYISKDFFIGILSNMIKTDQNIEELKLIQNVDERISRFLRNVYFKNITHVVFGHTHNKLTIKGDVLKIANDGAWQHTDPSYIGIYSDGEIRLFNYPEKKMLEKI